MTNADREIRWLSRIVRLVEKLSPEGKRWLAQRLAAKELARV